MGISSKLNEGRIYRLLKAALKMRRLQKNRNMQSSGAEILEAEIFFDVLLDGVLGDVDLVDVERVIVKLQSHR